MYVCVGPGCVRVHTYMFGSVCNSVFSSTCLFMVMVLRMCVRIFIMQ